MEKNRTWAVNHSDLKVEIQKTYTFSQWWRHPSGFAECLSIHFPYDTLIRLIRFRPEVIISSEMGLRTIQAALYRYLARNTRLIVWADLSAVTENGRGLVRERMRSWILGVADGVIVNGASGASYIERYGVHPSRIYRIPYTTDVESFAAVPIHRTGKVMHKLLYCGQLVELKGLVHFFSVLGNWAVNHSSINIELMIVGSGPLEARLKSIVLPSNLKIQYFPSVPYSEMPAVYAKAGILLLPTLADTWGLVVNEGMASGLPVLGSAYSQAVEELVTDNETGWVFRTDHPEEIYSAIDRALGVSGEEILLMRKRARHRALCLTPDSIVSKVYEAAARVWCEHQQ